MIIASETSPNVNGKLKIVIDIGGTKTLIKCYLAGETVYSDMSQTDVYVNETEQLETALKKATDSIRNSQQTITETIIIVGSAGYTPTTATAHKELLKNIQLTYPELNITETVCGNDSEIPLLLNPAFTLSIVAGTGSNIYIRKPDGGIEELGRFHTFHESNQGSGTKIATATIQKLSIQETLTPEQQTLAKIVENIFPNQDLRKLDLHEIVKNASLRQRTAQTAEAIITEAINGNTVAVTIMEHEIERFCETIHNKVSSYYQPGKQISTVITGSVGNNPFAAKMFEKAFQKLGSCNYTYNIHQNSKDLPYSGFNPTYP